MPIYQFVVRSGDHEDDPDVRWSNLPDEDAARRYGHLLSRISNRVDAMPMPLTFMSL
jgi:hypothetical protein